jgi:phosphoribosylamine---glycine ligase
MTKQILSKILHNFDYFNNTKQLSTMHILIIGSGGREHTIGWKLAENKNTTKLFFAPGNAGTLQFGTNLNAATNDFDAIISHCITHKIDIVVVGPEEPLVNGIYDAIKANELTNHINIIGPSKYAAQLEGSKSFAKTFMQKFNIPTANYKEFNNDNFEDGITYIKEQKLPVVLKADGLAGGKGVIICNSYMEAIAEYEMMLKFSKFGEAGSKVVIEEFLDGMEFSVFAITDGEHYKILPIAKDYKKIGEGDTGLNTGGMGAISPVPFVNETLYQKVIERIVEPTIHAFKEEKIVYKGFVFFGLICVKGEPMVIEYNCRLGDPETEVILPRLKNDLLDIFIKLNEGKLNEINIEIDERFAATIVAASGGYPNYYNVGYTVNGLNNYAKEDTTVFISGAVAEAENIVTTGGRVLAVTSLGSSISDAIKKSKLALENVGFEDMYFRKDIGFEFLN